MKKLPETVKKVWCITAWLVLLVEIIILVGLYIAGNIYDWYEGWLAGLAGLFLVIFLAKMILIPYRYAFHQYEIATDHVEIKKGFIFRSQYTIPIARVQNVNLNQGPILTSFNLYKASVDTAGDSHSIDAVTYKEADQIRKQVMQLAMEARNAR